MINNTISIIVPCYNEEESLPIFLEEISNVFSKLPYDYELLFIDDGSTDNTKKELICFAETNSHIKFICFSRNFGKEAAMYAGFCNSKGDYVAVMDADLQDPPSLLPEMIRILETEEYDNVATRRISREGEPVIRSFFARQFYKVINKISDVDIVDGARDFRLMKKEMIDVIKTLEERNRFSKGIFGWMGFRTYWLEFKNEERIAGETKWNFWKLFKYAIDGIISFSQIPLSVAAWFGIIMTGLSVFFLIVVIVRKLIFGDPVAGWASLVCIILFISGIQLFCIGIIGQYIAKTYVEVKKRPHYIISSTNVEKAKLIN